jgi:plastocyanin
VLLALLLVALVTAGALAATKSVGVKKDGSKWHFTSSSLTIKKGDTVSWHWKGKKYPHNVTGKGFHSKTAMTLTYKHKFKKAGSYKVVCTIHQGAGQKMTVKVK